MTSFALVSRAARCVPATRRFVSTSRRLMEAGSTGSGASRPGGSLSGDAFTRREAAEESMWIRNEEKAKLLELKRKISAQREHLDELDKSIDNIIDSEVKK